MTEFTPLQSLGGGILIGLATVMLMATVGRIMGATGILTGVLIPSGPADFWWRFLLILGLISSPIILSYIWGMTIVIKAPVPSYMVIIGGLIVGVGVTLGSGCTSGHGICGIARFSRRSVVATISYMLTAFLTVLMIRHILGIGL